MKIFQSIFQSGKAGKHIWRPQNLKGLGFPKIAKMGNLRYFIKKGCLQENWEGMDKNGERIWWRKRAPSNFNVLRQRGLTPCFIWSIAFLLHCPVLKSCSSPLWPCWPPVISFTTLIYNQTKVPVTFSWYHVLYVKNIVTYWDSFLDGLQ